jgi:hypothetical protein
VRIGLTRAQNAIRNPRLSLGIEVKLSDSRARAYIEEYDNRCWEADGLPAATERLLDNLGRGVTYKRLLEAIGRKSDNPSSRHLLRPTKGYRRWAPFRTRLVPF